MWTCSGHVRVVSAVCHRSRWLPWKTEVGKKNEKEIRGLFSESLVVMPSGVPRVGARTSDLMCFSHLMVGGVLLQVDMNALGDLKQPAPLGLQGVHVSLQEQQEQQQHSPNQTPKHTSQSIQRHLQVNQWVSNPQMHNQFKTLHPQRVQKYLLLFWLFYAWRHLF